MGARENLQRIASKKEQEITALKQQIALTEAYLQAINDSIRVLPREPSGKSSERVSLRSDSMLYKAREAILAAGEPQHIKALMKAIGKDEDDKGARVSLTGAIGWYVRKGQVFTRPKPNTFGVVEFEESTEIDLPENFGS